MASNLKRVSTLDFILRDVKINGKKEKSSYSYYLDDDINDMLEDEAIKNHTNKSQLVGDILRYVLEEKRSLEENK